MNIKKFRRKWKDWILLWGMVFLVIGGLLVLEHFYDVPIPAKPRTDVPFISMLVGSFLVLGLAVWSVRKTNYYRKELYKCQNQLKRDG